MLQRERHRAIGDVLAGRGRARVADLARDLDVTAETIRRDLDDLERRGLLRRVHGGAVPAGRGSLREDSLAERESERVDAKDRIARAAIEAVPALLTGSVLIDAGTTTVRVAAAIAAAAADGPAADRVVLTSSLPVAARLAGAPGVTLELLGGTVRGVTQAAVGGRTLRDLGEIRADIAVVGANGVSAGHGLSTPDDAEAAVKRAMVRAARRVVAVVDAAKHDEESLIRFASIEELDVLVTDREPAGELAIACEAAGVQVVVAP